VPPAAIERCALPGIEAVVLEESLESRVSQLEVAQPAQAAQKDLEVTPEFGEPPSALGAHEPSATDPAASTTDDFADADLAEAPRRSRHLFLDTAKLGGPVGTAALTGQLTETRRAEVAAPAVLELRCGEARVRLDRSAVLADLGAGDSDPQTPARTACEDTRVDPGSLRIDASPGQQVDRLGPRSRSRQPPHLHRFGFTTAPSGRLVRGRRAESLARSGWTPRP
jgi:hypothetical protein